MNLLKSAHPCIEVSVGVTSGSVDGWAHMFGGGGFTRLHCLDLSMFVLGVTQVPADRQQDDLGLVRTPFERVQGVHGRGRLGERQ